VALAVVRSRSAGNTIMNAGSIEAGGGGGDRGSSCNGDGARSGGSGGMIFVEAATFSGIVLWRPEAWWRERWRRDPRH